MSETGETVGGTLGDGVGDGDAGALLSRLRLIEDQPLEARAAAFAQINDELQARLENGDSARPHA